MGVEAPIVETVPVQDIGVTDIEILDYGVGGVRVVFLCDTIIFEADRMPVRQVVAKIVFHRSLMMVFIKKGLAYLGHKAVDIFTGPASRDAPPLMH